MHIPHYDDITDMNTGLSKGDQHRNYHVGISVSVFLQNDINYTISFELQVYVSPKTQKK